MRKLAKLSVTVNSIPASEPICNFCLKELKDTRRMVSSPDLPNVPRVHICDACILTCVRICWEGLS